MIRILAWTLLLTFGISLNSHAESELPDTLIKNAVQDVLTAIKQDKGKAEPKKLQTVVDGKVLPLFDFTLMTKRAVGPKWNAATTEQQQKIIEEFRSLLVRAYIGSKLVALSDRVVTFEPLKMNAADDQVEVKMLSTKSGEAAQPVVFTMQKTAAGWKVVDVQILGSFVAKKIYAPQFEKPLQQGIDGLIAWLVEKNQTAAQRKAESK